MYEFHDHLPAEEKLSIQTDFEEDSRNIAFGFEQTIINAIVD